ncbi:MAG TPA: hypothetical protein DC049_08440 [Spirochaetia bacterium]|nr:hypothetical protein [Spirochaetia bacterium]
MPIREKYIAIANDLEVKINKKKLKEYLPTQKNLMTDYRVAQRTISRAIKLLKDKNLVYFKPGIGNIILNKENNLKNKNRITKLTIAWFGSFKYLAKYNFEFNFDFLEGVLKGCKEFNSRFEIYDSSDKNHILNILSRYKEEKNIGGIIYDALYGIFDKKIIQIINKLHIPLITISFPHFKDNRLKFSTVSFSNNKIMKEIQNNINTKQTTYYFSFKNKKKLWIKFREAAFLKYFKNGKIFSCYKPKNFNITDNAELHKIGYDTVKKKINKIIFPCNFIAANDKIASGILKFLIEQKIGIPSEVNLIGIDNITEFTNDLISTVNCQYNILGYQVCSLFHKKLSFVIKGKFFNIESGIKFMQGITS